MLLVAGTVAGANNHSAFAWKEYKKDNNYQRDDNKYPTDGSDRSGISVPVTTSQDLECQTAGGTSPITASCTATSSNTETESGGILGK
jgi:hypothetical protein